MKAEVFIPCMADQFKPETAQNVFKVLRHLGIEARYPEQQTCCGLAAYNAGYWDEVKLLGEKFISEFASDRYVIMPSAACAHMVRDNYNRFFYNTSMHLEYKKLQTRVFELSDFLINVMHISAWKGKFKAKVMLHEESNSVIEYGMKDEPLQLLKMIEGISLVESVQKEPSCGFGGLFSVMYPQLSVDMAQAILQEATEGGAEYIITTETTCLIQLESIAQKNNIPVKIMMLVDLLADSLKNSDLVLSDDQHMTMG